MGKSHGIISIMLRLAIFILYVSIATRIMQSIFILSSISKALTIITLSKSDIIEKYGQIHNCFEYFNNPIHFLIASTNERTLAIILTKMRVFLNIFGKISFGLKNKLKI